MQSISTPQYKPLAVDTKRHRELQKFIGRMERKLEVKKTFYIDGLNHHFDEVSRSKPGLF